MRMRIARGASICLSAATLVIGAAVESHAQSIHAQPARVPLSVKPPIQEPCPWINAQSQFAPYYGKNKIHYDKFEWHIYKTDHFEIYYYAANEDHLQRVAGYAESAYEHVSSDLRHDLGQRVPLILFKTHSEFEQQNIAPGRLRKACWRSPKASATAWCCRSTAARTCFTG